MPEEIELPATSGRTSQSSIAPAASFEQGSTRRRLIAVWTMALALAGAPAASAQEPVPQPPDPAPQAAPRWSVKPFPSSDIYLPYVADPHRATNALSEAAIIDGGIPFTQGPLSRLSTGGRFGMVRLDPATPGGRAWQLSVDAGFDAIFDSNNRLDVVGWDGNYGLTLTTASSSRLSWKFAALHVSAHVGDEYQDRTDHDRINYTREEVSAGAAWRFTPTWRAYGETGVAYHTGHESLAPWRMQWGVEYEPGLTRKRLAHWYVGANFSAMEERAWRVEETVDIGVVFRTNGRTTRFFLEWHAGRPTVNEFFMNDVSSLTVGIRVDP